MKKIFALAAMTLSLSAAAQTAITFETGDSSYKTVGTYDLWDESPFRTGVLAGNAAVVSNPLVGEDNPSEKCLAYQRSRWAGNIYGARIDLETPFELTTSYQYVHVLINKPKEGRVMLLGLGKQNDNEKQSKEVVQFNVFSTQTVGTDEWYDAIFSIRGAGDIDIYSLVVCTDAENPVGLEEDHVAYIDDIVVNNSPAPRVLHGFYPTAFSAEQVSSKSDRYISSVTMEGDHSGRQSFSYTQNSPNTMYRSELPSIIHAVAGETIQPSVSYSGNWMGAFVYIDFDNDGQFDVDLSALSPENPLNGDLVAYSYIEVVENTSGYNSLGASVSGGSRNTLAMHPFTLPADMQPGMYRVRIKIDWGDADPMGRMTETNDIISNGGQIMDITLNVHGETGKLNQQGLNGDILAMDGATLNNTSIAFGQNVSVVQVPAPGFKPGEVIVRYGHNLQGEQYDAHENLQWLETTLPAAATSADSTLVIPAEYVIADLLLESNFLEDKGETAKGDYPVNFDKDTLMNKTSDRAVSALRLSGNTGATCDITGWSTTAPFPVFTDATDQYGIFEPGETITITATAARADWMYSYVYIDYNNDGYFTIADIEPIELVFANTSSQAGAGYVSNKPVFTLPSWLPDGDYRCRFKTDWACDDPGGRYGENWPASSADNTNFINDNRGQIIDFTLRVQANQATTDLKFDTEHCNIYAADGSALDSNLKGKASLTFKVVPVFDDYVLAEPISVTTADGTTTIDSPSEDGLVTASVNGPMTIRAIYKEASDSKWTCIFQDEFNAADSTSWDTNKWEPNPKTTNVTWSRFNSEDPNDSVAFHYNGSMRLLATYSQNAGAFRTGNLRTLGKCDFTYGKVEVRAFNNPWTGNFPAIWMMPSKQKDDWGGWPNSGEIDIFEQINWDNKVHHTVHTYYTNTLGKTYQKTTNNYQNMSQWHTYGLEWEENQIRWYVDGKQTHTYDRNEADAETLKQWPFDRNFYVIINQSVGNGSWASNYDPDHTYCMDVDFVRIYQLKSSTDAINQAEAIRQLYVRGDKGYLYINAPQETDVTVTDLGGRTIFAGNVQGSKTISAPAGVYIVLGQKVMVR